MQMRVDDIVIPERVRQQLGDVPALARSIHESGLLHPVVVRPDNVLIAGARRLAAVQLLGWESVPVTVVENLEEAGRALRAEADENTCREPLNAEEQVDLSERLRPFVEAEARERQQKAIRARDEKGRAVATGVNFTQVAEGNSRERVAAAVGASWRTLEKEREVVQAAREEPEKYGPILEKLNQDGKVDRAYRALKNQKPKPGPQVPEGEFDVVYADPPWQYDCSETEIREIENQYPTMTAKEIGEIAVPAASNSVLLLWATAPKLREALAVMADWGFRYITHAVWDKELIGMGYWFRGQHELLLVGVKGKMAPPDASLRHSSVFRSKRGKHSEKPALFYDWIEQSFPGRRYLELFARAPRQGWVIWGNEAP